MVRRRDGVTVRLVHGSLVVWGDLRDDIRSGVVTTQGIDLASLLQTEVIRAVLSPVGHVLWTAILGAVLFGAAHGRPRFRWTWSVLLAYVIVAVLHGLVARIKSGQTAEFHNAPRLTPRTLGFTSHSR